MSHKKKDPFWMEKAFAHSHGQLHKQMGISKNKNIPVDRLEAAAHSTSPTLKKRAVLARTARRFAGKKGKK